MRGKHIAESRVLPSGYYQGKIALHCRVYPGVFGVDLVMLFERP